MIEGLLVVICRGCRLSALPFALFYAVAAAFAADEMKLRAMS